MAMVLKESFDHFLDQWIDVKSEYWETSAYIKSTMKKYVRAEHDLSDRSVVLMYYEANRNFSFESFQNIGDWIFFTRVCLPGSIKCDIQFYESIGRSSYYNCHRYLKGSWRVYEELADNFHDFVEQLSL